MRSGRGKGAGPGAALTSDEHGDYGEDLLGLGVGADVAEADAGETGAREVERADVGAVLRRYVQRLVDDRVVQSFRQLIQPTWWDRG